MPFRYLLKEFLCFALHFEIGFLVKEQEHVKLHFWNQHLRFLTRLVVSFLNTLEASWTTQQCSLFRTVELRRAGIIQDQPGEHLSDDQVPLLFHLVQAPDSQRVIPRIQNLPYSIFDPPIHPNLPLSSPCPCCLSRCLILQPPQLVKLLKELTLPSSTDLKFSVAHNIVSLYRTTPYDLQFLLVIFSTDRFMENLVQDTSINSETAFSA